MVGVVSLRREMSGRQRKRQEEDEGNSQRYRCRFRASFIIDYDHF